jgi:hypothetical protein
MQDKYNVRLRLQTADAPAACLNALAAAQAAALKRAFLVQKLGAAAVVRSRASPMQTQRQCSAAAAHYKTKQLMLKQNLPHILVAERANSSLICACRALTSLKRRSRLYLQTVTDLNLCGEGRVALHSGATLP